MYLSWFPEIRLEREKERDRETETETERGRQTEREGSLGSRRRTSEENKIQL